MNAAVILQKRSMKEAKMRCMTLLSDGDGKTHQYLNEIKVHGKNFTIMKEECMNHVVKIVGTGLRNVVQDWKKKSVTLGRSRRPLGGFAASTHFAQHCPCRLALSHFFFSFKYCMKISGIDHKTIVDFIFFVDNRFP
ncbi:hypothetical protein AVEN_11885-1 [Araneus ventricosus]|uniref:Mutator-like transposase domain-containing protein n=1 Tax=Araneus ventricosus TaxID=182803 RepID=A0A4Y2RV92_ARAVE|nr:hypothetical protein AVEN_11885-1 [Araneus ventricosus]